MAGAAATVSIAATRDAGTSQEANPELGQVRALLKAHDEAAFSDRVCNLRPDLSERLLVLFVLADG